MSNNSQDEKYHNIIEQDDGEGEGDGGDVKIDHDDEASTLTMNTFLSALIGMASGNNISYSGGGNEGDSSSSSSSEKLGLPVVNQVSVSVDTPLASIPSYNTAPTSTEVNDTLLRIDDGSPCERMTTSSLTLPSNKSNNNGDDGDSVESITSDPPNVDITKREVKFKLGTLRPKSSPV